MRNFYDMLSVGAGAPADEIKKAFRREIARYHPDKVQHLGQEFQEMAAGIAADLTEAYRILMDPELRAKYDEEVLGRAGPGGPPPAAPRSAPPQDAAPPRAEPARPVGGSPDPPFAPPAASSRSATTAGGEFVKKASLSRLNAAVAEVMGGAEPDHASGFDLALTSSPKRGLFKKADERVRLLVKFVPIVDAIAVADVWGQALKGRTADTVLCVLLVGPGLAPSNDLAMAISEQRRKTRGVGPVLVPVDVRDWEALFPPDTPAAVRAVIQRLKDEKR